MKDRLFLKLFVLLLAVTSAVVVAMLLLTRLSFHAGFVDYLNDIQERRLERAGVALERYYAESGSWEPLRRDPRRLHALLAGALRARDTGSNPSPAVPPTRQARYRQDPPVPLARRIAVFDAEYRPLVGRHPPRELTLRPLQVAGATVGWIGTRPLQAPAETTDIRFFERQARNLLLIGLLMIVLIGSASWFLARRLLTPVHALARSARELAAGNYQTRVPVHGRDELSRLSADFNRLAEALQANEGSRRRWIADISHELRTPLAILHGEIEALQDGIRRPDAATLASLHQEATRLGKVVEELYQLALSDIGALNYQKRQVDAVALLFGAVDSHRPRFEAAGLVLEFDSPSEGPLLFADPERLEQLYHNLLENSLRYTEKGGRTVVDWTEQNGMLRLNFQDSAPGVAETELPRLFDRLYRGEASRNRERGGAGLGLAICKKIVEAHQGRIGARPSPLGGVWILVELPLREPASASEGSDGHR